MSLTLRLLASSSALVISSSNSAFGKNCRLRISETRCFSPPDSSAIDLVSVSGESPNRVRSSVNFLDQAFGCGCAGENQIVVHRVAKQGRRLHAV